MASNSYLLNLPWDKGMGGDADVPCPKGKLSYTLLKRRVAAWMLKKHFLVGIWEDLGFLNGNVSCRIKSDVGK